jgi:hypothetical protein
MREVSTKLKAQKNDAKVNRRVTAKCVFILPQGTASSFYHKSYGFEV